MMAAKGASGRAGVRVAWALAALVGAGADEFRPSPRFEGRSIPDPPMQGEPWTPPATTLPRFLVRAAGELFGRGVADPRGCEYREVEVGDGSLLATRGFVLPERAGIPGRFVVGWDGIVYPAATVGAAADLDADIHALAGSIRAGREEAATRKPGAFGPAVGFTGMGGRMFWGAGAKITGPASVETRSALKVCLLLRLGRADLAEELFAAGTIWKPEAGRLDLTDYRISYLTLAREWAGRAYNRAVDAHGRGDDAIALDASRRVSAFVKAAEARLAELGFPTSRNRGGGSGPPTYFPNLSQLGVLLADQERRAQEPPRGPIPGPDATPEARVAALIRDLDLISGSGSGFIMNGITSPTGSGAERALVREGAAAVGPLLAVLESDDRLTRTISYPGSRHGADDRSISFVYVAAQSALTGILGTRVIPGSVGYFQPDDRAARVREVAAFRAFWEKNRDVPLLERFFRDLADDSASPAQWLDAAEALSQPADIRGRGGSYAVPYRVGGKVPVARGERLRDRKGPSVTDLIARRCESLDPTGPKRSAPVPGSGSDVHVNEANRMARCLAAWDPPGSLPTLKDRVLRCASIVRASEGGNSSRDNGLESEIARMTRLRQDAGDPGALDDYAAWVRTVTPAGFSFFPVEMFEPIWREPDHPAIAAAALALFADPKSPWIPLFQPLERGWSGDAFKSGLVGSPLLGVEPFRKLVIAGLADRRTSGSVTVDADGKIAEKLDDGTTQFPDPLQRDPLRPKPGTSMPLRLADMYCWKLQGLGGTPRFELYWPEANRDDAIARCLAFLNQYGPRFRYQPATKPLLEASLFYPQHQKAILGFDRLDHPATPEEVRLGRAIFSLEGAEARPCSSPTLPIPARWTTLEVPDDDPGLRGVDRSKGRPQARIEMLQGGLVWQAEEANQGGTWRRSYGFVGPSVMARVSAEDVEFPAPWSTGWSPVSAGLDGRVIPPGGFDDGVRIVRGPATLGQPLPVEAWLRNRRGVDSQVPADWARLEGGLSLRDGLTIRLYRQTGAPAPPARGGVLVRPPEEEINAREVRRHRDGEAPRTLGPAASEPVLRLDLRDLFPVEASGFYRLTIESDALKSAEGGPGRLFADFTILKPGEKPADP